MKEFENFGLALGSGGGRGLVHIGVLKALESRGLRPSFIAGSSIGACIGAMFAAGRSALEVEELFLSKRGEVVATLFDPGFIGGVVRGRSLAKALERWIGVKTFEELKIPFAAVAADLLSGDPVVMSAGNLVDAVRGSMAVPGLFKPVDREGMRLVDGGVVNPVPDDVVKAMGAKKVIAVNLDYRKVAADRAGKYLLGVNVMLRSMNIMRHYLAEYSLQDADIILNPEIEDPGIVGLKSYLNLEKARGLIDLGEKLMLKHL